MDHRMIIVIFITDTETMSSILIILDVDASTGRRR